MKNLFCKIVATVLLVSVTSSLAWAQGKIVTINLQKVFEKYWKTKQAESELRSRGDDMEKEHKNMLNDWTKAREDHQHLLSAANDQSASAEDREKSKRAADSKLKYLKDTEESILQYEKQARTTLDEQKRRTIDKILAEIRTLVAEQAKSAGAATLRSDEFKELAHCYRIERHLSRRNAMETAQLQAAHLYRKNSFRDT